MLFSTLRRTFLNNQSGNVFAMLFGGVALVGILGASTMQFIRGPLTTAVNVNRQTTAEAQMSTSAQLAMTTAAGQANGGDCDNDAFVEPIPWKAPSGKSPQDASGSEGGGMIPDNIGTSKTDPWGTDYGYCVWDHGAEDGSSDAGCGTSVPNGGSQNRLEGTNDQTQITLAIISAGKDREFQTACKSFPTADTDSDGDLSKTSEKILDKKSGSDDITYTRTYQEASESSGGLWELKTSESDTATHQAQDVEVTGSKAAFDTKTGEGTFQLLKTDGLIHNPDTAQTHIDVNSLTQFTGDVGIGTDSPQTTLDVEGNLKVGSTTARATNGRLTMPGGTSDAIFSVQDGNGRSHWYWNVKPSAQEYLVGSEGASWLRVGNGTIQMKTAPGGTAGNSIPWNLGLYQNSSGQVGIGTNPGSKFHVSGGDSVFDGQVGIGTASPGDKLEIVGDMRMSGSSFKHIFMDGGSSTKTLGIHYGGGGNNQLRFGRYGDNFGGWEANPYYFDLDAPDNTIHTGDAGNVGLGTSSPGEQLHVADDVRIDGSGSTIGGSDITNASLRIGNSFGIDPNEMYFNGSKGNFGTLSSHDLDINTNATSRIRVEAGGDVGIGTTNPQDKLHVSGTSRIDGNLDMNGSIIMPQGEIYEANLIDLANNEESTFSGRCDDSNGGGSGNGVIWYDRDNGGEPVLYICGQGSSWEIPTKAWVNAADSNTDGDTDSSNEVQNLNEVLSEGDDAGGQDIRNLSNLFFTSGLDQIKFTNGTDHWYWMSKPGSNHAFAVYSPSEGGSISGFQFSINDNNGNVRMHSNRITGLSDPSNAQDAATKSWVNSNDGTGTDDQTLSEVLNQGNDAGGRDAVNLGTLSADIVNFSPTTGSHPGYDGSIYRYSGQAYIGVDDNLYIRDAGGAKNPFRFDTNNGNLRIKGEARPDSIRLYGNNNYLMNTSSGRLYMAPYDDGSWQWGREFGYNPGSNRWYIDNLSNCGKVYTDSSGNLRCGSDNNTDGDTSSSNEGAQHQCSGNNVFLDGNGNCRDITTNYGSPIHGDLIQTDTLDGGEIDESSLSCSAITGGSGLCDGSDDGGGVAVKPGNIYKVQDENNSGQQVFVTCNDGNDVMLAPSCGTYSSNALSEIDVENNHKSGGSPYAATLSCLADNGSSYVSAKAFCLSVP